MMLKSNTFFTVWMFCLQVMTAFAGIFFFSTVPMATTELASSLKAVRTVTLKFYEPSTEYSYENLREIIACNGISNPESFTFGFYSDAEYELIAHTNVGTYAGSVVEGRGISDADITMESYVVVAGTTVIEEEYDQLVKTNLKLGDSITVGGTEYEIVGFKSTSSKNLEIPYTTGFSSFALSSIAITFPEGLSDRQFDEIEKYAVNALHNTVADRKLDIGDVLYSYNGSMIFTAIFVVIIALLNLCFVYKFILKRMSGYFAVLKICGESSKGLVALVYSVYYIILILSFVTGMVGLLVVKQTAGFEFLAKADISFKVILAVFFAFATVMSALLVQAVITIRKPVKEELLT